MKQFKTIFNFILAIILCFGFTNSLAIDQSKEAEEQILKMMQQPPSLERDSTVLMSILRIWDDVLPVEDTYFKQACTDFINFELTNSQWSRANACKLWLLSIKNLAENKLYNAFDFLEQAMLEFKSLGDLESYRFVINKFIPLMNWNMIENEISEDSKVKYAVYIKDALTEAEKTDNLPITANIKITLASYQLFVLKNYNESLSTVYELLEMLEPKDKREWFDYYYITKMGEALNKLNLGNEAEGRAILNNTINACDTNNDLRQAQYVRGQLAAFTGRYYLNKGKYKEAYRYATEAEKGVHYLNFPYFQNYLNKTLYEVYKYNQEPDKALKYLEEVKAYQEQAESDKLNQKFAEWQLIYETEKQNNRIKTLENETLIQSQERSKIILNSLISLLLLGLLSTIFILNGRNKLKHKNIELQQKNIEISKAMLEGQNQERKRVASELHDNLNTKIAALKWSIETIQPDASLDQKRISSLTKILDDIYLDVRLISHNLIPEDLETFGIGVAIQKLINSLNDHPIKFNFIKKGMNKRPTIVIEYQIYNIILELINNVLKHSEATQCWISLSNNEDEIILSVSDNGKGMGDPKENNGVGLKNISSRVASLKGEIAFPKNKGNGFIVSIAIPQENYN